MRAGTASSDITSGDSTPAYNIESIESRARPKARMRNTVPGRNARVRNPAAAPGEPSGRTSDRAAVSVRNTPANTLPETDATTYVLL